MKWQVVFTRNAEKQISKLPKRVQHALELLVEDIKEMGPVQGKWPNYGKLKGNPERHHCHLKKGKSPTYVAVWEETQTQIKLVKVIYVVTHEKAPY